jgi:hypothetical protein
LGQRAAVRGEWLVYRIAGLPIAFAAALRVSGDGPVDQLRRAYAAYYWQPTNAADATELVAYFTAGVLPPWYYIFQLHNGGGTSRARRFLHRCETKRGVFRLLTDRGPNASPLQDKPAFARRCRQNGLAAPATCAVLGRTAEVRRSHLPPEDLFVKPARGRGGKGAERWDYCGDGRYREPAGEVLDGEALISRLRSLPSAERWLIQPRLKVHPSIADLSNGALCTVRAVTCLDEHNRPELMAAVLRMAIGANRRSTTSTRAGSPPASILRAVSWAPPATSVWMPGSAGSTGIPTPAGSFAGAG